MKENNDELVPYKLSDILRSKRKGSNGGQAFNKKTKNRTKNKLGRKSRRFNLKKGLGK